MRLVNVFGCDFIVLTWNFDGGELFEGEGSCICIEGSVWSIF